MMTKSEFKKGLLMGRTLCQEEWCDDEEKKAIDELISEGIATATPWAYHDNFQCERRFIIGITPRTNIQ